MSAEFQAVFGWTGESMVPASNWHKKVCDARLVIGERYIVDVYLARSEKSHRHYFACIGECFKNWPEAAERQFDGAEHMRKYALIRTGYRTERQFVASSNAEALRLAAFLRGADDYAEISVKGNIVVEWKATSQSAHAMGAKDFAASKEAVLAFLAGIIGVTVDSLKAQHDQPKIAPPSEPKRLAPPKRQEAPHTPATVNASSSQGPDDLTVEDALEIIWKGADDETIHNISVGGVMIGAIWDMADAVETIKSSRRRVLYDFRNHELGVVESNGRRSLFETDADAVATLRKRKSEPPAKSLLPGTEGNASVESPAAIPHGGGAGATKGWQP